MTEPRARDMEIGNDLVASYHCDRKAVGRGIRLSRRIAQALADARAEGVEALRRAVVELCENTEEFCIASDGADSPENAFLRGRIHEAKGARRSICEVARALTGGTGNG